MTTKENFICPNCKTKNRIKVHDVINHDKILSLITKEMFFHECKSCHQKYYVEYPLKVEGENYLVYYTPGKNEPIDDNSKEILRVCDTFDDLKEKLLILEDNLNDVVIEFIKTYIKKNLDKKIIDEVDRIRYDGKDENNLIFYLSGVKENAAISLEIYEKLKDKIKVKKINKCVLIDEYTYTKYYKMRLL